MRIQIMSLPAVLVDDHLQEPFAIVVDQCPAEAVSEFFAGQVNSFAGDCGAKAVLITSETVEVVDPYADDGPVSDETIDRFADEVAGRLARHYGGWYPEPPASPEHVVDVRFPEDFDPEQATREFRFKLGLCVECGERPGRCGCPTKEPEPEPQGEQG